LQLAKLFFAKTTQISVTFCVSKFQKMGDFAAFIERSKAKSVSASGWLRPPPSNPDQGLCPWNPLGAPPPDPRYRLALCILAMAPLCQILNTPLHLLSITSCYSIKTTQAKNYEILQDPYK